MVEVLLNVAERVDGDLVDEALIADLYELRDRAHSALDRRYRAASQRCPITPAPTHALDAHDRNNKPRLSEAFLVEERMMGFEPTTFCMASVLWFESHHRANTPS
jgi:hypothetical protein